MGKVVKFWRKQNAQRGTWRAQQRRSSLWHRGRRFSIGLVVIAALAFFQQVYKPSRLDGTLSVPRSIAADSDFAASGEVTCYSPYIIDGDTFSCTEQRIRLVGIDAPEMPDHCKPGRRCTEGDPFAAKDYLQSISRGQVVCHPVDTDNYGRTVAKCEAGGKDLSCAMVAAHHAIKRYRPISCP